MMLNKHREYNGEVDVTVEGIRTVDPNNIATMDKFIIGFFLAPFRSLTLAAKNTRKHRSRGARLP